MSVEALSLWHTEGPPEALSDFKLLDMESVYQKLKIIDDLSRARQRTFRKRQRRRPSSKGQVPLLKHFHGNEQQKQPNGTSLAVNAEIDELVQQITKLDSARTALRERAMDLSRSSLRKLSILDLPMEILHQITDQFQDPFLQSPHGGGRRNIQLTKKKEYLSNVQNIRSVCRRFNESMSRHLFPRLKVELSQASLERAEAILQNPFIAAGVRTVELMLAYRPSSIAGDFARFTELRLRKVNESHSVWGYFCHSRGGSSAYTSGLACPIPLDEVGKARTNYRTICEAWKSDTATRGVEGRSESFDKYQCMLHRAYAEYRRLHEEQAELVRDGEFAARLAAGLRQTRQHGITLRLTDENETDRPYLPTDTAALLIDHHKLYRSMIASHDWRGIESIGGERIDLAPARLLWQLPIAIHKSGAFLKSISIDCFPVQGDCHAVCPDGNGSLSPTWRDLRLACQDLQVFELGRVGLNHLSLRKERATDEDRACIDQFLASMLSGRHLERIHINMYSFGFWGANSTGRKWHPLGKVLSSIHWPKLKYIQLENVAFETDAELEMMCTSIVRQSPRVFLSMVELEDGTWCRTLDILRRGLAPRFSNQTLDFGLVGPSGGEFGRTACRPDNLWDCVEMRLSQRDSPLITKAQQYASGDPEARLNPLLLS
jgi:hypothetical protein